MKFHSFFSELFVFLLIFGLLIFPEFFVISKNISSSFSLWNFSSLILNIFLASFSLMIFLVYSQKDEQRFSFFPVILITCLLFCFSFFTQFLAMTFFKNNIHDNVEFLLPKNVISWIFCILIFFSSSIFEEMIYRFYLPNTLLNFLNHFYKSKNLKVKKVLMILCEFFACICFSFAHKYLGFFAVLNAFFAHIILRFSLKKTSSIFPNIFAHFSYNFINLFLI